MNKIMVMLADGFEEVEALTVVDVLRRAEVQCDMICLEEKRSVAGAHKIIVHADYSIDEVNTSEYDGIVLPGGMPGAVNLRNSIKVVETVKDYYAAGKLVAAICAAPIVFEKAGIISGKKVTSYPSFAEQLGNSIYCTDAVCVDNHVITSRGPATALAFAYEILSYLGKEKEAEELKEGMLYNL